VKKVLLHTCCGPCLLGSIAYIKEHLHDWDVFAVFYNPNIHPLSEWIRRRDGFLDVVRVESIPGFAPMVWDAKEWFKECGVSDDRCGCCYRIRFQWIAQFAKKYGFHYFSTTLTISPYQIKELIYREAEKVAKDYDLEYLKVDFSPYYRYSEDHAKELGIYRQKYCGCVFSEAEAWQMRMKGGWFKL
jgi:hypothetical protein